MPIIPGRFVRGFSWGIFPFVAGLFVIVRGADVGPKSIHKEARFLIDHAPCAVLVVKGLRADDQ